MAVANHPDFATQATENDDATGQAVFRMLGQPLEHRLLLMLSNISCYATEKALARRVLRHAANVAGDQLHGIAPIAAKKAVTMLRLRRGAIDDGYEIICDDDSVLAFHLWILRDEFLFDNLHERVCFYTRRNTHAEPVSRPEYGQRRRVRAYRGRSRCTTFR